LILLDPPYRLALTQVQRMIGSLVEKGLLEEGAVVVLERDAATEFDWGPPFRLHARKRYGSTEVDIAVFERGSGQA
jgi:16S rRNA G966 N2-methylase RsmD